MKFTGLTPGVVAFCLHSMSDGEVKKMEAYASQAEGADYLQRVSIWLQKHRPDLIAAATPERCRRAMLSALEWQLKHGRKDRP